MKDALYTIALQNADRYEALARRAETASDEELGHPERPEFYALGR